MNKQKNNRTGSYLLYAVAVLFVGSIIWSMATETLLPLWRAGDQRGFFLNLVGLPLFLLGMGLIVYGGALFVLATLQSLTSEPMLLERGIIQLKYSAERTRAARKQIRQLFWQAWKRPLIWLMAGGLSIALGSFITNF